MRLLSGWHVRMALFWACQLPTSPRSPKAPRSLSVQERPGHFGQIAALWGRKSRARHFHFDIFQGVMSRNVAVLRTDRLGARCSLVMLTIFWDQVRRACSIVRTKQKSANLVTAISSSLLLCPPGGRCSAGPCENVQIPPVEGWDGCLQSDILLFPPATRVSDEL